MKAKNPAVIIIGIVLMFLLTTFIYLVSIRSEFSTFLGEKYPDRSFEIGFTKYNVLYGNFYSKVICLDDGTLFFISKNAQTNIISEDYVQSKRLQVD